MTASTPGPQEPALGDEDLADLYENAPCGFLSLSPSGQIVRANQTFWNWIGFAPETVIGQRRFAEILCRGSGIYYETHYLPLVLMQGFLNEVALEVQCADGRRLAVLANATLLRGPDGKPRLIRIAMLEARQRRQYERELLLAQQQAEHLASHDPLTGLFNRARFQARLEEALAFARRDGSRFAVLLLDMDRFKGINDNYGHHCGDLFLKEVAARLRRCVRESDTVARIGGDEFCILQTHVATETDVRELGERLVYALHQPYVLESFHLTSAASVGAALFPDNAADPDALLQAADLALYRAKAAGRNNLQLFDKTLHEAARARRLQEQALRTALDQQDFELYYQPQLYLDSLQLRGVEVLLRSQAPGLEGLNAAEIVALADAMGLMVPLGDWIFHTATRQISAWRKLLPTDFRVAINLSASQLRDPELLARIRRALHRAALPPQWLELEVTEQLLHHNPVTQATLEQLSAEGVQINVDDFGIGLSALAHLKTVPLGAIKLDHEVVQNLQDSRLNQGVVMAVVALAKSLGMEVIAEGVETPEQLQLLIRSGCTSAQGYLFQPPLPAAAFTEFLVRQSLLTS